MTIPTEYECWSCRDCLVGFIKDNKSDDKCPRCSSTNIVKNGSIKT